MRTRGFIAAAVILAFAAACSGEDVDYEGQITVDQLQSEGFDSLEGVFDRLRCEYVSIGAGWDTGGDFDSEAALALAREQADVLGVTEPVETVREIGPELWAVGADSGVALGVVTRSSVAFCG